MSLTNGGSTTAVKRKATTSPGPSKKPKSAPSRFDHSRKEEEYIVDREFYPPQMSNERCAMYKNNELERPIETLEKAQKETKAWRDKLPVKDAVIHWFKSDLRLADNKALHLASEKAKSKNVPLICLYVVSPQDFKAHARSPVRVDFMLRSLQVLKEDLDEFDIPLVILIEEKRKNIPNLILERCQQWGASHLFTNIEYEVDELRREALLTRKGVESAVAVDTVHDTCVIQPGLLSSGSGSQYSVYSPWFRAWLSYLHTHSYHLKLYDEPKNNPSITREKFKELFNWPIPDAPDNKRLTDQERKRFESMWPAGEHEARDRVCKFVNERIKTYKETRNFPAANATAVVSVHLAAGTLSARTAIAMAQESNTTKKLDGGISGIAGWISEVAWRDFYRHVLVHWPYVCMNKPFKPEFSGIQWEYENRMFEKWSHGVTGYPFIDAAMRQLNFSGYMHNRARMGVASFLAKDLMIDWRMGEKYFMLHLIDGDFASNNGGWGFSASTGVDPQPYFRIFNPILQSEKFDPDGEYIRRWVPELAHVQGKAIHDPHGRGAKGILAYPKMCVDHKTSRNRALARYKAGLGRDNA
ncbi:uncharacterized protein KY384_001470 [Bacidia gigantensis]|uniref:uncharacterized protein n=1 Tax=Bacidia gigantensis TaxID=2732470 RepID=UPI001D046EF6|nr:uncharacterized protein KY384_001470 [Bacidia gigantensis]KAG8533729.1 hypothetical protein KY384_001470 [Bacidia gigantensis]